MMKFIKDFIIKLIKLPLKILFGKTTLKVLASGTWEATGVNNKMVTLSHHDNRYMALLGLFKNPVFHIKIKYKSLKKIR